MPAERSTRRNDEGSPYSRRTARKNASPPKRSGFRGFLSGLLGLKPAGDAQTAADDDHDDDRMEIEAPPEPARITRSQTTSGLSRRAFSPPSSAAPAVPGRYSSVNEHGRLEAAAPISETSISQLRPPPSPALSSRQVGGFVPTAFTPSFQTLTPRRSFDTSFASQGNAFSPVRSPPQPLSNPFRAGGLSASHSLPTGLSALAAQAAADGADSRSRTGRHLYLGPGYTSQSIARRRKQLAMAAAQQRPFSATLPTVDPSIGAGKRRRVEDDEDAPPSPISRPKPSPSMPSFSAFTAPSKPALVSSPASALKPTPAPVASTSKLPPKPADEPRKARRTTFAGSIVRDIIADEEKSRPAPVAISNPYEREDEPEALKEAIAAASTPRRSTRQAAKTPARATPKPMSAIDRVEASMPAEYRAATPKRKAASKEPVAAPVVKPAPKPKPISAPIELSEDEDDLVEVTPPPKKAKAVETAKPSAPVKPAEPVKAVEPPKPASKPVAVPKPVSMPTETPKPVSKPVETPKLPFAFGKAPEPTPAKPAEPPVAAEPPKAKLAPAAFSASPSPFTFSAPKPQEPTPAPSTVKPDAPVVSKPAIVETTTASKLPQPFDGSSIAALVVASQVDAETRKRVMAVDLSSLPVVKLL